MDKARPVLAGAAATLAAVLVAASAVLPHVRSAPGPGVVGVVVPAVLFGCALLIVARGHRWPGALLAAAASLWCVLGVVPGAPGPVGDGFARLGVLPLALLVVVVLALPLGRPGAARLPIALALGVAVAAGAGLPVPVRFSLGTILVISAAHGVHERSRPGAAHTQAILFAIGARAGVGAALLILDPVVSGNALRPGWAAGAVGLTMAAAAVTAAWILDPERLVWNEAQTRAAPGDRLGIEMWVGDLLGSPGLRVCYPDGRGGHLLEDGSSCPAPTGPAVVSAGGATIAWFDHDVALDPAIRPGLVRLLGTVGASARLRASQRERSEQLARSRARLAEAAFEERVALERRLARSVLPLLDAIEARSALLPDPDAVRSRVGAARAQVRASARGLWPVGSRSLAEALAAVALIAPHLVTVDVDALDAATGTPIPDDAEATALWFAAAEAVSNALKHAGGSVTVRALGPCLLEVVDDGPGGADPAGSGLVGIRDRLHAVGGSVGLISGPSGTRLAATVPGRLRAGPYRVGGLAAMTPHADPSYGR